jgi:GTP-binding protein Era
MNYKSDGQDLPFRSGFVAVMGKPNVGKSTLINTLLRQKVTAVSPRPQTTRKRQMGILTIKGADMGAQAVFVDTPGVHNPRHKLGELMNREAIQTLEESDLVLFVVDASQPPDDEDRLLFDLLGRLNEKTPVILALNKIDLAGERLPAYQEAFTGAVPRALPLPISARRGDNLDALLDALLERLPEGEPFFPEDQVTDLYEREIAADLIREAALNILRDEIPHGIAVRIDEFTERETGGAYIEATIFVERESHKPIVIGEGARMIKKIGSAARQQIESMSGRKVFLRLNVKVRKNWRDDEKVLRSFGY